MSDQPAPDRDGLPSPRAEALVQAADSEDRLETARAAARRRLFVASAVTLVAPVNFVVQALVFWGTSWPSAGAFALVITVLLALAFWFRWGLAAQEVRERQEDLRSLLREQRRLPSGESGPA